MTCSLCVLHPPPSSQVEVGQPRLMLLGLTSKKPGSPGDRHKEGHLSGDTAFTASSEKS